MGAHRGCSEHRSVYRQQRETIEIDRHSASSNASRPTNYHNISSSSSNASEKRSAKSLRYPEFDIPYTVMDEKQAYRATPPPTSTRMSRRKHLVLLLVASAYMVYTIWQFATGVSVPAETRFVPQEDAPVQAADKKLVPLEAHIMSKCPDARDCLRDLVLPTMMKSYDKVNFTLSYIGTPTEDDGVACKHGPSECMGNILELCAIHLYPDPKINLGFTMCLTREYSAIPDRSLVEDCALEHAIDIKALNDCATQDDVGFGVGLLRDSVRRSKEAGVTKSCTVRLDEEFYCIRDDGQWKDCPHGAGVNDLVIAIEKLYRTANS
ncbi:hypothetical protein CCHL11_02713 [Colletotrichum chlorophyti]|uniref:Uncharacterized protein n=1 Tax=Colletotrichum chlorophyti TaxID=708187 RepID=A0A1Q8S2S6_9PEZI|nr:hypothetical protein CCHL11_02713 [Colletotrichum chlorophyti]